MNYLSVAEIAKKWGLSVRTVRHYCANGRISGAFLSGKKWYIPETAQRPERINQKIYKPKTLLETLEDEKKQQIRGGIYHKVQIAFAYNSNRIEGSRLTQEQTRYIYETNTIGISEQISNVDDIIETMNHFRCVDLVIDAAGYPLSESFIKRLHRILKSSTSDARKKWFAVGAYKRLPNEVGGRETTPPEQVTQQMQALLSAYKKQEKKSLEDLISFHVDFEAIHPFQDGNGRVGRLILFKECLRNHIVPFIIDEDLKLFYYRGLREWHTEPGYLMDTCLTAQDTFKNYLNYFRIPY